MKKSAFGIALVAAFATAASAQVTGHVDLYSSYVLRGNAAGPNGSGPESAVPAVQWGLDYATPFGLYVGYWGSSLTYKASVEHDEEGQLSTEHDLYVGYAKTFGAVTVDVGVTEYFYHPDLIAKTYSTEPKLKISAFGAYVQAQYNATDVVYSNAGDTYLTAGYSYGFAGDVTVGATLGWYLYADSSKYIGKPENSQAFRHVTISASKKLTPNLIVGLDGILGGKDRMDKDLGSAVVAHASVVF